MTGWPARCASGSATAVLSGDVQGLMDLIAPDVVVLSDGGGKVQRRAAAGRGRRRGSQVAGRDHAQGGPGSAAGADHDQRRTGLARLGR